MGNHLNAGHKPGRKTLLRDLDKLKHRRDQLWEIQERRYHEKFPEYGSYTDANFGEVVENLGRNVVQFTRATTIFVNDSLYEDAVLKQAGDIINLVLMAVDRAGVRK